MLSRLSKAGITLNVNKCAFRQCEVKFLEHTVSAEGIRVDPDKVEAITQIDAPKDTSKVRSFLGSANHLAKFLPVLADMTKPLRDLMRADAEWYWGPAQQQSFESVKQALSDN